MIISYSIKHEYLNSMRTHNYLNKCHIESWEQFSKLSYAFADIQNPGADILWSEYFFVLRGYSVTTVCLTNET